MEPRHGAQPQERGAGAHRLEPRALPWAAAQRRLLAEEAREVFRPCSHGQARRGSSLLRPKFILLRVTWCLFLYSKKSPIGEAGSEGDGSKAGTRAPEVLVSGLSC